MLLHLFKCPNAAQETLKRNLNPILPIPLSPPIATLISRKQAHSFRQSLVPVSICSHFSVPGVETE